MKGLTSTAAADLLTKYGPNVITARSKRSFLHKILEQFNNFLMYLLMGAAVISLVIGETVDGLLILAIVILNGVFGLYQEEKAENELEKLSQMTITTVRVMRDGREQEIDSRQLVPGDYVFIEEGTKIPADGVLEVAVNLEVNEASLTGESYPVTKATKDQVFGGTVASRGRGFFTVTKTGMNTKFGEIAQALSDVTKEKTPLQKKLIGISRIIGYAGIGLAILVFILSYLQGVGYFPSFLLAVSLAVAVVPEGLPAVMTITLAIGVGAMAKRKSIMRRLSAIESLGSVTLIATDKTGTLTTNKMNVAEIYVDRKQYKVPDLPKTTDLPFSKMVLDGILCSTASLVFVHPSTSSGQAKNWDILGDPTEGALLLLAKDVGLDPEKVRKSWKLIEEVPFDSTTKMMTVMVQSMNNEINKKSHNSSSILHKPGPLVFSKGAPESILGLSSKIFEGNKEIKMTPEKKKELEKVVETWAKRGLRVIAFSYKKGDRGPTSPRLRGVSKKDPNPKPLTPDSDMTFIGLVAIHDPPRPEAKHAIQVAHDAGIKVVMITGDNEKTAEAIGVATGLLGEGDEIMTGQQIEEYDDTELMKHLRRVKAFARTTPLHKTRIVKLYQKMGEVVAVTGDGVNDAIALKQADVGVAMGLVGTDVARETADMVVTDDNFASIVAAIEEGRHIIRNLKNSLKYLLASNISEAIALIVALLLGIPNLLYPIQLLYINLIGDGLPALALAFSPREEEVMKRPPTKILSLLSSYDRWYVIGVGILTSVVVLFFYFFFAGGDKETARTAAFSVLALTQAFIFIDLWLSHRSLFRNAKYLKSKLFFAAFALPFILQWIIVSNAHAAHIFKIVPVTLPVFGLFIIGALLILPAIEFVKLFLPKKAV